MIPRASGLRSLTAAGFVRLAGVALACAASASCAPPGPRAPGAEASSGPPRVIADPFAPVDLGGARYFQLNPDEAYWVTHDDALDRVVVGGARYELSPSGEVKGAAWESEDAAQGDLLQGSLAVAPRLGGGFIHWSQTRVFRSTAFTGPLEAIALGRGAGDGGPAIRGARNGLRGVVVVTEGGPVEIDPQARRAGPVSEPALADLAALDARRAIRVDVFGRASTTKDGGSTWIDASATVGIAARSIAVGTSDLFLDTWLGRAKVGDDGQVGDVDRSYAGPDFGRPFQVIFQGTRAMERDGMPWTFRDAPPLLAAAYGGVTLADGSALAVAHGGVARVNLITGVARAMTTDWIPQGIECAAAPALDGTLFLCASEGYQGVATYVLRSERGEPPVVEKAFSDDGYFVTDDRGAVGFVGSCAAKPRLIDPEERARDGGEITTRPVFCVRRGPGQWAELSLDMEPDTSLIGWIPSADGSAVALVMGSRPDQLPPALSAPGRWSSRGAVRVLRVYQELAGFRWSKPAWRPYAYGRGAPTIFVDKRFRVRSLDLAPSGQGAPPGAVDARPGAIIDGWMPLGEATDMAERIRAGFSVGLDGIPKVYPLPPMASSVVATGDFGVTITDDGRLFETVDRGRTWRAAGRSPVASGALSGGCSRIGCVIASITRVGWGASSVEASIAAERPSEASARAGSDARAAALPTLVCEPVGAPVPSAGGEPPSGAGGGRRGGGAVSVLTGYGDFVEILRDAEAAEEPDPSAALPSGAGNPSPPAGAPTSSPQAPPSKAGRRAPGASPAVVRTHTVVFRVPFDVDGAVKRIPATGAAFGYRRPPAVPLLGPAGDVSLLLFPDGDELLITNNDAISLAAYETRRYGYGDSAPATGLQIGRDGAVVIGDARRRTTIEEHGRALGKPPLFIAAPLSEMRRRPLALGRSDDGAIGVIVLDGPAPETAGVARFDRSTGALAPVMKLAPWSTLTPASDPRCKADKDAFSALFFVEPRASFALDARALPGVTLGAQGLIKARWGRERVCVEAVDLVALDARRRSEPGTSTLVARFSGASPSASLLWQGMKQEARCALAPGSAGAR